MQATDLRNRVHRIENEHELMWTALDDIARMHKDHPSGKHAKEILKLVITKYGR
jgi:hypothetical protein